MRAFATVGDVAARWPGYEASMGDACEALLLDASARLAAMLASAGVEVDIEDETQAQNLLGVTCSVVIRALNAAQVAGGMPVSQWTETATPYSNSFIFSNPNGDLYLTKMERASLGLSGGRAAFKPLMRP